MARERVQTRCDAATVEQIDDFADEQELSKSEAVRRLVRTGLAENGYQIAVADGMGTGQLSELAEQLDRVEQRQAARANQRERLDVALNVSILSGLSYIVAVVGLGASGPLWTAVGVMAVVSIVAAQLWARRLEDSE